MSKMDKMIVEMRVASEGKQAVYAFLLAIFLGFFGAHRFYLGRTGSAIGLLVLSLLTGPFLFFLPSLLWVIVDLFLIQGIVSEENEKLRLKLKEMYSEE